MKEKKKGLDIMGALSDMAIFALFVGGAGFAGYFIGINQQVAPIKIVPPGTAVSAQLFMSQLIGLERPDQTHAPAPLTAEVNQEKAVEKPAANDTAETAHASKSDAQPGKKDKEPKESKNVTGHKTDKAAKKDDSKKRYFLASNGVAYTGNAITATVNDHPIDQFFGPGKLVDVSGFVKKGPNHVVLSVKTLGDDYNMYLGRKDKKLVLNLVEATNLSDDYSDANVLLTFSQSAADMENKQASFQVIVR